MDKGAGGGRLTRKGEREGEGSKGECPPRPLCVEVEKPMSHLSITIFEISAAKFQAALKGTGLR